jgi:hypothetical protein
MALQMNDVLAKHGLNVHVCAYVKNEGNNISTMALINLCCAL